MKDKIQTKNPGGRPTVLTPETITKLEAILKIGGTIQQACGYAEIGESTYHANINTNESFKRKMDSAKYFADIAAKNIVVDKIINDKDLATAKWWLEKREYATSIKAGVSVDDGEREIKLILDIPSIERN